MTLRRLSLVAGALLALLAVSCDAAPSTLPLSVDAAAATANVANLAVSAASTQQAVSVATQQEQRAQATQHAQATADTLSLTPSAATAVMLRATQDSIVAASTSDAIALVTARALDAERVNATRSALAIEATQQQQRSADATSAAAMFGYLKVCFGIAALVLFASLSVLGSLALQHTIERHRVRSMLHTTPSGLYLVYVEGDRIVSRAIDAPAQLIDSQRSLAVLPRPADDTPATSSARTLAIRDPGDAQHHIIDWPSPAQALATQRSDATRLADILSLLSDSMDASRPSSQRIPRFDKLRHYKTRPAEWGKLTDRLVACALAEKRTGPPPRGGTFLTGDYTLYTLSAALQSGAVKLRPTVAPRSQVVSSIVT